MNTYGEEIACLARSIAQLLARGSRAHASYADPDAVLAARDSVLSGIRSAYDAVLRGDTGSGAPAGPDPVRALQTALHDLPRAAPDVRPSRAADLAYETQPGGTWRAAAAAAVALDRYQNSLQRLPHLAASTTMRDLAQLAHGLVELDHDLALGLSRDRVNPASLVALDRSYAQAAVQQAVDGIAMDADHQPVDRTADRLRGHVPPRPIVVRTADNLPESAQRMAAMLHVIDRNIALRDVAIVTATLVHSATIGGDVLFEQANASGADGLRPVAQALHELRPLLASLSASRVGIATLTTPSGAIATQCREMLAALRRLPDRGDSLRPNARPTVARPLTPAVLAWANEVPAVAVALNRAIVAAANDGRLMIPADLDSRGRVPHLWRPASPGEDLAILDRAAELEHSTGRLARIAGSVLERQHRSDPRLDGPPAASAYLRRVLADRDCSRDAVTIRSIEPATRGFGRS